MESNTNTPTTATTTTSTPSSSIVSRTVLLLLRVLTFVFLLIALVLIVLTKDDESEIKFKDFHAYRVFTLQPIKTGHISRFVCGSHKFFTLVEGYMISTIVIGFAYNSLQMALSIFSAVSGNRVLNGDGGYKFDFYGDKIISYFLVSGSAAGFGATEDLHRIFKAEELPLNSFFGKANASASFLLFGFIATAIASVFTSFALPKKAK